MEPTVSSHRLPHSMDAIGALEAPVALKLVLVAWKAHGTDNFSPEVGIDLLSLSRFNTCISAATDHDATEMSFRCLWLTLAGKLHNERFVNEFVEQQKLGYATIDEENANAYLTDSGVDVLVKAAWLPEMRRLRGQFMRFPGLTQDEGQALYCVITAEVNSPGQAWTGYYMDLPPSIDAGMRSLESRGFVKIKDDNRAYLLEACLEHVAISTMTA